MNYKMVSIAFACFFSFTNLTLAAKMPIVGTSLITQNGFYIGADVGAADFMDKESHTVTPESHQLGSIGAVGGIFIGYDYGLNNKVRLAVEGFADATDLNTSLQHASNTYKMDQDYNLGLRLLPEYVFTPFTVGHVILGYANGRFHINDNGVYGLINTSYNQSGFQTGLGVTTALKNNIFIRLDALYDTYPSKTNQGVGLTSPTQSYSNRFSQLAGEFSVIYKIC
jgi:opacity protein-like surface antigen